MKTSWRRGRGHCVNAECLGILNILEQEQEVRPRPPLPASGLLSNKTRHNVKSISFLPMYIKASKYHFCFFPSHSGYGFSTSKRILSNHRKQFHPASHQLIQTFHLSLTDQAAAIYNTFNLLRKTPPQYGFIQKDSYTNKRRIRKGIKKWKIRNDE